MSMVNDIDWDEEKEFRNVYFEFRTSQELSEEGSREDTGHSREMKKNGTELTTTNLKKLRFQDGGDTSRKLDTPILNGISAFSRGILERKKVASVPHTSMRSRRKQNSCFAHPLKKSDQYLRSSFKLM